MCWTARDHCRPPGRHPRRGALPALLSRLIVAVPVGSSLGWDVCRRCLPMLLPPLECGHRDPYARDHLAGACPWRAAS